MNLNEAQTEPLQVSESKLLQSLLEEPTNSECNSQAKDVERKQEHLNSVTKKTYSCIQCGMSFQTTNELFSHASTLKHGLISSKRNGLNTVYTYKHRYCHKTFKKSMYIFSHVRNHKINLENTNVATSGWQNKSNSSPVNMKQLKNIGSTISTSKAF